MPNSRFLSALIFLLAASLGATGILAQQAVAPNGVPAHMVVTVEPHHGHDVPPVNKEDVMVYQGRDRDTVTDWVPAQGDHAALELFILIDDASTSSLGTQLDDLRKFINGQPESAKIGVAYMQNGTAKILQDLTSDHTKAARALRLPMGIGGVNASPYFSLSDLVKKWPASDARHEVFMVTDGIDRYYGSRDLDDPYLAEAIDDAARAGVIVSAIYSPDAGHYGHSYWETYWGQIYLAELADKTGGEGYYIGMTGPPVAFAPYLDEFALRLTHQYLLTFLAKPPKKAGFVQVRLRTEVQSVDLVSAGKVWVSPERQ
ncbi:MAG TPA: hypothetical protein VMD99_14525 [Terriglobales bacterium]|nr:hypothetical protein [Terriglobales bacterium]